MNSEEVEIERSAAEVRAGCITVYLSFHRKDVGLEGLAEMLSAHHGDPGAQRAVILHILGSGSVPPLISGRKPSSPSDERTNLRVPIRASNPVLAPLFAALSEIPERAERNYSVLRLLAFLTRHLPYGNRPGFEHLPYYKAILKNDVRSDVVAEQAERAPAAHAIAPPASPPSASPIRAPGAAQIPTNAERQIVSLPAPENKPSETEPPFVRPRVKWNFEG